MGEIKSILWLMIDKRNYLLYVLPESSFNQFLLK